MSRDARHAVKCRRSDYALHIDNLIYEFLVILASSFVVSLTTE